MLKSKPRTMPAKRSHGPWANLLPWRKSAGRELSAQTPFGTYFVWPLPKSNRWRVYFTAVSREATKATREEAIRVAETDWRARTKQAERMIGGGA